MRWKKEGTDRYVSNKVNNRYGVVTRVHRGPSMQIGRWAASIFDATKNHKHARVGFFDTMTEAKDATRQGMENN